MLVSDFIKKIYKTMLKLLIKISFRNKDEVYFFLLAKDRARSLCVFLEPNQ